MTCTSRTLLCASASLGFAFAGAANAAVLTQWTFETSLPTTAGPHAAEVGTGNASGLHAGASTYSNPAGNGTAESFSSNNWVAGDYYQFQTSTLGQGGVYLVFDATSSNTGPRDFKIQWSTDNSTYTDLANYSVLANNVPNNVWTSGTYFPEHTYGPFSAPAGAWDNLTDLYIRLTQVGNVSANGGTVASSGTSRVDTVTIGVPEPTTLGLLAFGALGMIRRRRAD